MDKQTDRDDIARTLGLDGRSRRNRILGRAVASVALVALVAAAAAWLYGRDGEGQGPIYRTEPAAKRDLVVTVSATGTLEPTNEVDVSSELSGTVRRVLVDHNSPVKAGDVLATLDTDKLEAEVALARAALAARRAKVEEAKATLAEAERELRRQAALLPRGHTSEQSHDVARAGFERARAAVASAEADVAVGAATLRLKETDFAKACICSPIDGVVLKRNVDPGQIVASNFQAPVLFTLAEDLRQMELQVAVDEADVSLVADGQSALFTVDAYPTRVFSATVTRVRYAPDTTEGVVTYEAQLTVDNRDLALRPGMTATAEITVRTVEGALLVPNEALRFTPPEAKPKTEGGWLGRLVLRPPQLTASKHEAVSQKPGERRLYVLDGGVAKPVIVTIGLTDGRYTEILGSGGAVAPGTAVVVDMTEARR